jgi:DNA-binding NtrC family response regulator/tetratricopeptide (TPR) repeat protein
MDLPLSPLRYLTRIFSRNGGAKPEHAARRVKEQYRAPWGEDYTRHKGRAVGWLELTSLLEKTLYPVVLTYFALFDRDVFWLTLTAETLLCMGLLAYTADRGSKLKYAAMAVPALPVRLMSLGVDVFAIGRCLFDIATGDVDSAARWGLAAARGLLREEQEAEDPLLLVEVIASVEREAGLAGPRARRRGWALRFRAAQALDRASRTQEALDLIAGESDGSPAWYAKATKLLRAEILERSGRVPEAIAELEGVAPALEGGRRPASSHVDPAAMEAAARLAALYFRAGVARRGRACLQLGRDVLAAARSGKNGLAGASAARALGLFARAESSHGDAENAMALLEEALRIARGTGRDDLARGPLNELGILYAKHRRWASALKVFGEIATAARGRGDLRGALKAAYNQAIIHYRLHDLDLAEDLFREARRISEELGRHDLEAAILVGFAGVLRERGRWLPALKLYRRVIRLGPRARPHDLALAHGNIRELYLLLGRLGKSIRHANLAYRIARGLEDRFLRGATLRFRGIARWALGRSAEARRDLEQALRAAEEAGDARASGAASYYLGLLASAGGDAKEAIRRLRAGIISSRRAGDAPHISLGKAAILSELSSLGRRRAARCILLGGPQAGQWARASLQARVLAIRSDPRWPANHEEVIDACAGAARDGLAWESFLALTDSLRDPDLSGAARDSIALARAAGAARILRSVPRRFEEEFRRHWGLLEEQAEAEDRLREHGDIALISAPGEAGAFGPLSSFLENASSGRAYLRALLDDLVAFAGASSAWVTHDESVDRQPFAASGRRAGGRLSGAPRGHEAALARARQDGVAVEAFPYLFVKLPHPSASRVLCVELKTPERPPRELIDGILSRAATAALALRLIDVEEDLRGERARHEAASSEVHRLNVVIAKDKQNLETALLTQRLEANDLRRELAARSDEPRGSRPPAAASPAMRSILARLPGIALRDIPVLLTGESGAGKDFLARWIHHLSPRRGGAFVAEICDVPESLIEAELFGFVKGSFTGAMSDRPGLFQRAAGGTIYLDEISELASAVQARLLRVLEEKRVRPVGGEESLPVDFRLISSSRHAAGELSDRGLRRDLLFRINTEVIEVPPLRERPEDIPLLLEEAIRDHTRLTGLPAPYVHPEVKERMAAYAWPGNVRELFNEVERVLVERPVEVTPDMLLLGGRRRTKGGASPVPSLREERSRVEQELLVRALEESGGNASKASIPTVMTAES